MKLTIPAIFLAVSPIAVLPLGARYWAEAPDKGPEDRGLRLQATFLSP